MSFLFASEATSESCPDKLCDRVADAVLDACLAQDPDARVSCDACTKSSMVMILGEVATKASVNFEQVIREAVKSVGYDSDDKGLDWRTMNVIVAVEELSPEFGSGTIMGGVAAAAGPADEANLADPGVVCGYATDETPQLMPMSHCLATAVCSWLDTVRKHGTLAWARPGGGAQVVLEYQEKADGSVAPVSIRSLSLTVPRAPGVSAEQVEKDLMEHVVRPALPGGLCNDRTEYRFPDPSKQPRSDVGMSGKRIGADTYGGWGLQTGSSCCGRDTSKVSRIATYGARWAAQSLVAAKLCKRAAVQLGYASGSAGPVSVLVNTFGSAKACGGRSDADLAELVRKSFDLRPAALARKLCLNGVQFQRLSAYGHFGRTDLELPWEKPVDLK